MVSPALALPLDQIEEFCRRNHIRKLSLFGSILTERFRPESDIDILVEFEPGSKVTLFRHSRNGTGVDGEAGAQSRSSDRRRSQPVFPGSGCNDSGRSI